MTFQEAQAKFSAIIAGASPNLSAAELLQKQRDLLALQDSLPLTPDFDVLANALAEFSPKFTGLIAQATLDSLKKTESAIKEAANLLTKVGAQANADARTLTFDKPKLVLSALTESVAQLQDLRTAAKNKDFDQAAAKVDALTTLVQQVIGSIKSS